jgi:hypothetical protein
MTLKSKLIRLAWENPSFREEIIPILKTASPKDPAALALENQQRSQRELLFSDQTFLMAKHGDRVKMHLNLGVKWKKYGMKTWSVKDRSGSKTIGHVYSAVLRDVKFIVRESGSAQVRGGGEKTVHAFAEGILVYADLEGGYSGFRGDEVKYNPHRQYKKFCIKDPNRDPCADCGNDLDYTRPITKADSVFMSPDWKVWAKGAK